MFPQDRNLHGKVFGGILMRMVSVKASERMKTMLMRYRLCEYTRYSSKYRRLSVQRALLYQCGDLLFQTSTLSLLGPDHFPPSRTYRSGPSPLVKSRTHHTATSRSQWRSSGTYYGPGRGRGGGNRGKFLIQYAVPVLADQGTGTARNQHLLLYNGQGGS